MSSSLRPKQRAALVFVGGALFGVAVTLVAGSMIRGSGSPAVDPALDPAAAMGTGRGALAEVPSTDEPVAGRSGSTYPYRILGRVSDGAGRGLSAARVTVRDESGGPPIRALTDAEGRFEVEGVPLGLYAVEANAPGFSGAVLTGITPDGPALELRLHGEGAAVGRALVDGQGRTGLTVLIGAPGVFPPVRQSTGPDGRFAIEVWEGVEHVELAVFGDGYGSGFVMREAPATGQAFDVALRPAPDLRLAIAGEGGSPVEGGVVALSSGPLHLLDVAVPVADGAAAVSGLPPGSYLARIEAPGFLPLERVVEHTGAEEPQSVVLTAGGSVGGVVLSQGGEPVAGAFVGAVVRDERGRRWQLGGVGGEQVARLVSPDGQAFWPPDATVRTDDTGRFRLAGLPAGMAVLSAAHPDFEPGQTDALRVEGAEAIDGVELRLVPLSSPR